MAVSFMTGLRFPSAPPEKGNPQSIEIAGFSLCINAFGHFLLSANAENILYLRK
nr:MAG TPA: hypothetical protein [Bacteriophage sp.]